MYDWANLIGIAAAIVAAVSHVIYIVSILKGKTKPSRVTWFVWSILALVIALSYRSSGATSTLWLPIGEALWYIIIALLSIKYGEGGWNTIDKIALVGIIFSAFLWYKTGSALLALIASLGVDFMAVIPTIYKCYQQPYLESKTAWVITVLGSIINIMGVREFSFSILLYPLYMLIANGFITLLLFRKPSLDVNKV